MLAPGMMRTCFIRKGCDKYNLVWIQSGIKKENKETIRNMQAHANSQKPSHTIIHHHDQTMAKRWPNDGQTLFFFLHGQTSNCWDARQAGLGRGTVEPSPRRQLEDAGRKELEALQQGAREDAEEARRMTFLYLFDR